MIEGFEDFIKKIIENKKEFIIVTNTLKENIDFFSELFPILKKSSKNYYREMFKNKKPNPECYLNVLKDFSNKKMVGLLFRKIMGIKKLFSTILNTGASGNVRAFPLSVNRVPPSVLKSCKCPTSESCSSK
jgi:hypothetical protein